MITTVSEELGRDPTAFALLPDHRIVYTTHQDGGVKLLVNGQVRAEPLLTFPNQAKTSEQGLLGIAVDPDFPDSNYVYIFHTEDDSTNRVTRFTVQGELSDPSSNELTIDPATGRDLLVLPDLSRFHNGGTIRFGRDKTLYVSHGDDEHRVKLQDLNEPNGKILRINRDGTAAADNPVFEDDAENPRGDIFAIGLRNPFRFSIDPVTDALFIGDVGSNVHEEFNLAYGGENFGFPYYEGPVVFLPEYPLIGPAPTPPVFSYPYGTGSRTAIALVAYRQRDYPNDSSFPTPFDGTYFFADFFDDELKYLRPDGFGGWESVSFGSGFRGLVDGAIAEDGGIYLLEYGSISSQDGTLSKITYIGSVSAEASELPHDATLEQNYPNPFVDRTEIRYRLESAHDVRLTVFDVLGREIEVLASGRQPPGVHVTEFDGAHLAPGTYFYQLRTGGRVVTRSMVHIGR